MASQFIKAGQVGWFHDQGHDAGFFHTYDAIKVGGQWDIPRKVHVFLPRDYETSEEPYPVIYMNDGDTAFFPGGAFNKSWYMADILSKLYAQNQIRKVIVVAVSPLNRDREYTHAPVWAKECCGLASYSSYLANSLRGFMDANYRTLSDARNNLILGSSHGGLAAFYIATSYPDKFGNLAALSPSFWVGLDSTPLGLPFLRSLKSSELLDIARPTLQNPNKRLKIYLDWGLVREGGFHNSFIEDRATVRGREMRDLLTRHFGYMLNKDLFLVEDAQGDHTEEAWSRRTPNMLKIFFS